MTYDYQLNVNIISWQQTCEQKYYQDPFSFYNCSFDSKFMFYFEKILLRIAAARFHYISIFYSVQNNSNYMDYFLCRLCTASSNSPN